MKKYLLMASACVVFFACDKKAEDKKAEDKGSNAGAEARTNTVAKAKEILGTLEVADYSKSAVNSSSQDASVNFNDNVKSPEGYYIHAGVLVRPCQMDKGCTYTEDKLKDQVLFKKEEKQKVSVIDVDGQKVYLLHATYFDAANKVAKNQGRAFYGNGNYEVVVDLQGSGFKKDNEAEIAKLDAAQYEAVVKQVMGALIPKL
ncbi:MAG: hypothetical protein KF690_06090 [Bacteroidetes bacterium]|nr:hypothetical protein [Bacteroidota bacterium]